MYNRFHFWRQVWLLHTINKQRHKNVFYFCCDCHCGTQREKRKRTLSIDTALCIPWCKFSLHMYHYCFHLTVCQYRRLELYQQVVNMISELKSITICTRTDNSTKYYDFRRKKCKSSWVQLKKNHLPLEQVAYRRIRTHSSGETKKNHFR